MGFANGQRADGKTVKITASLAVIFILLNPLTNLFAFYSLHRTSNQLSSDIHAIYFRHFPNSTSMVAPRERMLTKLGHSTDKTVFLGLLAQAGTVLSQLPAVRLQQIDFRNGKLKISVESNTFDTLDTLMTNLKKTGLTVKQQNAMKADTEVRADFLLSADSARRTS